MKPVFERIWELALPYQDQRDDSGHAEVALQYARLLLETEGGNEDVVIPAIILHDVGYSQLPKERRLKVFDRENREERLAVQLEHQRLGVELARAILTDVGYPPDLVPEILEIISQHDTRQGFISVNEGLVRDADKLWRYSKRCAEAGEVRRKAMKERPGKAPETWEEAEKRWKQAEEEIEKPGYFYSDRAREIARREFRARRDEASRRCGQAAQSSVP